MHGAGRFSTIARLNGPIGPPEARSGRLARDIEEDKALRPQHVSVAALFGQAGAPPSVASGPVSSWQDALDHNRQQLAEKRAREAGEGGRDTIFRGCVFHFQGFTEGEQQAAAGSGLTLYRLSELVAAHGGQVRYFTQQSKRGSLSTSVSVTRQKAVTHIVARNLSFARKQKLVPDTARVAAGREGWVLGHGEKFEEDVIGDKARSLLGVGSVSSTSLRRKKAFVVLPEYISECVKAKRRLPERHFLPETVENPLQRAARLSFGLDELHGDAVIAEKEEGNPNPQAAQQCATGAPSFSDGPSMAGKKPQPRESKRSERGAQLQQWSYRDLLRGDSGSVCARPAEASGESDGAAPITSASARNRSNVRVDTAKRKKPSLRVAPVHRLTHAVRSRVAPAHGRVPGGFVRPALSRRGDRPPKRQRRS